MASDVDAGDVDAGDGKVGSAVGDMAVGAGGAEVEGASGDVAAGASGAPCAGAGALLGEAGVAGAGGPWDCAAEGPTWTRSGRELSVLSSDSWPS